MPTQLSLRFEEVPISCPAQQRYHSIAPCLAGQSSPAEQAAVLNISYNTVTRWLRRFREQRLDEQDEPRNNEGRQTEEPDEDIPVRPRGREQHRKREERDTRAEQAAQHHELAASTASTVHRGLRARTRCDPACVLRANAQVQLRAPSRPAGESRLCEVARLRTT